MRPLRIGINALFRGKPTGVANYLRNLVRHVPAIDRAHQYYVLLAPDTREYFDLSGENVHELPCSVDVGKPMMRRSWEQLVLPRIVRSHKLDLLHSPVNIMPLAAGCRSVVTILDCQYFGDEGQNDLLRKWFHQVFMRLTLRRADAIITISESMKREILRSVGPTTKAIHVTHLGQGLRNGDTSPGPCRGRTVPSLGLSTPYVLFVGYPQRRKNVPGLIDAFAMARERLQARYLLVICGDMRTKTESDRTEIARRIEAHGLGDDVRILDYVTEDDLRALYAGASLFAFPTLYEGFGLPVVEAMACGAPVLVSDIPVMREIVGDAGAYVDPRDSEGIAGKICQLLQDDALRDDLREKGAQRAERFTWRKTGEQTLSVYRQVGATVAS